MPTCKKLRRKVDFQKDHCKIPGRGRDKMNWESTSKKIVMGAGLTEFVMTDCNRHL